MAEKNKIPEHVAIIPDGNRRWAKARGMKPWEGHEAGAQNVENLARKAFASGVGCLSFWGSSLDNLEKRPLREKRELLEIYEKYFKKLIASGDIRKYETRINVIGRWRERFPKKLKNILEKGITQTRRHKKTVLNFFLAYNGDDEMIEAVKNIAGEYRKGQKISGETIKRHLMTRELPPVDLLIRTGGDPHLSVGFMMWDIANAQLYFSEKFFPDFKEKELEKAINEYQRREQRQGR